MKTIAIILSVCLFAISGMLFFQCTALWTPARCPEIKSFTPSGAAFGAVVRVVGTDFLKGAPGDYLVRIGSTEVPVENIKIPASDTLLITMPKGIGNGKISIALRNGGDCPKAESTEELVYYYTVKSAEKFVGKEGSCVECFNAPGGMAVDLSGNVYVADRNNNAIKRIAPDGKIILYAGTGVPNWHDDPDGNLAQFSSPSDVDIDKNGNIYVADETNHCIRKIDAGERHTVTTVSGNKVSGDVDNTNLVSARYVRPIGIAVDKDSSKIFVTEFSKSRLRMLDISTATGFVSSVLGGTDGLKNPAGVAFSRARGVKNSIYVADQNNGLVKSVAVNKNVLNVPGNFPSPVDVALDKSGVIYITEQTTNKVYSVDRDNKQTAIAGAGINFPFIKPYGIVFDDLNKCIYVSDEMLHIIVKIVVE